MYGMEKIIELQARENIGKAMRTFGIEGTQQKIKETYKNTPKVKEYMLDVYDKILKGENL